MKIGILGSGAVAKSLAAGCMRHGHAVMLGTRTPAKLDDVVVQHLQTGALSKALKS